MKKNYYLLSTVLLLCCIFNVKIAQAQTTVPVTFQVDMNGQEATSAFITGTFTSTSGDDQNWEILPMTDADEDGIFTYSTALAPGATGGYYFLTSGTDWAAKETVPAECALAHDNTNRQYAIPTDAATAVNYAFAWGSCEPVGNLIPNHEFNTFSDPTAADEYPANRLKKLTENTDPATQGGWVGGFSDDESDDIEFTIDETGKLSGANSAHLIFNTVVQTAPAEDGVAQFWNNGDYFVFFEATQGTKYEFSFDVVASEEVTFQVAMNEEPWDGADHFSIPVTATTTPTRVTVQTTDARPIDATQMHKIFFANFPETSTGYEIWIDNAVLTPIVETIEEPEAPATLPDSVVWTLDITGSTSQAATGLQAQEETVTGIVIDPNLHRGGQRLIPTGGWPAGITAPQGDTYIEFAASTAAGYAFDIDSMAISLGGRNSEAFRAAVYYSTNGFAGSTADDSTEVFTSGNLFSNDDEKHSVLLDLDLAAEDTLTIRVYPWIHEGASVATGAYLLMQDVILAGTVTSNMPECEVAEAPYHLVSPGGNWTESTQVNLNEGDTLTFGPWPRTGYTWSWAGPNGWTAEGREPVVENFTTEMTGDYVATYTNGTCMGTIAFTVTIGDGGTDPEPGELTPVVNVYPTPEAGIKEVAYVTSNKTMWEGATDPIRAMLEADTLLNLTVYELADGDVITDDLNAFDAIVIQEGFNSGAAILQSTGSLALGSMPVPFLYNKTYALRNGRGLVSGGGTSFEGAGMGITVPSFNQNDLLFEGITFDATNTFRVFDTTAFDNGRADTVGTRKTFNYTQGITPFPASTLLGSPSGDTLEMPASTAFLNFLPEGSVIGSDTTEAPAIFMGMNIGAISANGGENMTEEGLRLWRNAVYLLAGIGEVEQEPLADNAALFDVTLSAGSVVIMEGTSVYDVELPAGTTSVTINTATPMDENATVTMDPTAGVVDVSSGSGMATITVTAEDGETEMVYTIDFTVEEEITKVGGLAAEGVVIYPNPVNGNSTLNLRNAKELVSVNVYTAQGVLVRTITADNSGNISIQVSDLAEGLYLLKAVKQDRSVLTGKFVK